jgi:hypothetical protein
MLVSRVVVHRTRRVARADHHGALPSSATFIDPAGYAGDSGPTAMGFSRNVKRWECPIWGGIEGWQEELLECMKYGATVMLLMIPPPCNN